MKKIFLIFIFFLSFFSYLFSMSSTNYQVVRDSVNTFGTEESSSSSFKISDTGAQTASGPSESSSFQSQAGYRQVDNNFLFEITCDDSYLNLSSISSFGKSTLGDENFVTCNIKTDDPKGYVFQTRSFGEELVNTVDSNYKIPPINFTTPNFWPASLDSGWGIHLSKDSSTFDSTKWGDEDNYLADGGKWAKVPKESFFEISRRNSKTESSGDDQKIYFGMEVGEDELLPSGQYKTNLEFIVIPTF